MPMQVNFRLITGLGNPGDQYMATRHNLGFMVVDRLLSRLRGNREPVRFGESLVWHKSFRGQRIHLQKPLTYMNASGKAVIAFMNKEGISPEELLVVYDDIDIPLGKIRLRKKGSSGGHNGVQSIIDTIGTDTFTRLRVGIASEQPGNNQVDFVLGPFSEEEVPVRNQVTDIAADAIMAVLSQGVDRAMNDYNHRTAVIDNSDPQQSIQPS